MGIVKDIKGQRFGRLLAVELECVRNRRAYWRCICDCGNEKTVCVGDLTCGKTLSCGCLKAEKAKQTGKKRAKHLGCSERLYVVWADVKVRCYVPNSVSYKLYGARGITMCDEWKNDYNAFREWAMANGYDASAKRGECTLDRIDVNGIYEPNNCRFVSSKTQNNNKRTNILITSNGETHSLAEWARIRNIPIDTIKWRRRAGWQGERLIQPSHK